MICTCKKVYNTLTDTYSTGYCECMKDSQGYWHTVWSKGEVKSNDQCNHEKREKSKGRRIMIKIIKRGTKKVTTCEFCGCEFSYEGEDVCHIEQSPLCLVKQYIQCPQCSREIELSRTKDTKMVE